jgi:glycosyltransferase involved in cell wall biosynthesis
MRRKTIAYIMSRFPKISETFILYEILELERLGLHVEIFPLIHQKEPVVHSEAQAAVDRAHYSSYLSRSMLSAQLYWLYKRPGTYLKTWWKAVWGNITSPKFLTRALAIVPQASLFARQMQELGVEHVHAHWATHPALAAYVIHQLTGLRYSITAHAHDIHVERPMLGEKIQEAEFVVTISEYNRRFLGELYGTPVTDKTIVVHCGVDPDVFKPQQTVPRIENDKFTIICVASLEVRKGHHYLIEACAQLKAYNVNFECLFIGDGPARARIETQIEQLDLADSINLLGYQPRHRVSELLAQADVMVLPSITIKSGKKEGIPVALMEALAMEIPVISTDMSGIPELIEHEQTGLLVPECDSMALATELLRIYRDPQWGLRLGVAGRAKVLKEFNLRRNTAILCTLFTQPSFKANALLNQKSVLNTEYVG